MKYFPSAGATLLLTFCISAVLQGCIDLSEKKSESRTVTLKDFRSAESLSYKTSDLDWIQIENDPDDVYSFETGSDKKYQITIDCPFNSRNKQRHYFLDSRSFPQLNLGCDGVLNAQVELSDNSVIPDNLRSYDLQIGESTEYLIYYPCQILCIDNNALQENKRIRVDADSDIRVLGQICFKDGFCTAYSGNFSYTDLIQPVNLDLSDQNFHYGESYATGSITGDAQYISADHKVYNLGPGIVPDTLRRKGDGYQLSLGHYGTVTNPEPTQLLTQILATDISNIPENPFPLSTTNLPAISLNGTLANSSSEPENSAIKDMLIFDEYSGNDLIVDFYSYSDEEYDFFISPVYAENGKFSVPLSEPLILGADPDAVNFLMIFFGNLTLNGTLRQKPDNHLLRPTVSIQDQSAF